MPDSPTIERMNLDAPHKQGNASTIYRKGLSIVTAVDEIEYSLRALKFIFAKLATSPDDIVTALVVVSDADHNHNEKQARKAANHLVTTIHNAFPTCTFTYMVSVSPQPSKIGPSICEIVETARADMVVMGHSARLERDGFVSGSVTNYVLAHAQCPVLVVRVSEENERALLLEKERCGENE
ncbi:hypothetical protein HDU81_007308 [Chytriomyces hyalinus]|nr:hypothetical protein HDU81_007308 [Chytriomyces hyalinus]